VHVDGLVGASIRLVPYLSEQLALADHTTGPFDEVCQQFELACREFERLATKRDLLAFEVDGYLSHGHRSLLRVRSRPAEDGAEAGLEVLCRIRLHDVVVGARVEQPDDLGLVVSSRCDDYRHISDRSNHAERFCAVEVWKAKVEDHNVESSRHRRLNTRHSRCGGVDLVASLRKPTRQRLPDPLIVFDNQDGRHAVTIPNHFSVDRTTDRISSAVNRPLSVEPSGSGIMVVCGA